MAIVDDIRALHSQTADDLAAIGPDADGGVPGWSAHDLAAHLMSQAGAARYGLAVARLVLARGIRPGDRAGPATNAAVVRFYRRRSFGRAVEVVRSGPPFPLLVGRLAPVALFEIWVHDDDLRRANGLSPVGEPESLASVVAFLARLQRSRLGNIELDRSASAAELVRWLTGRPSSIPPHTPALSI